MKILVCGDRNWTNKLRIVRVLGELLIVQFNEDVTIIHGDCRGADRMAGEVATALGFKVIAVPADWKKYGRAAGVVRNKKMFDENAPDIVLAFHSNIDESKGTKHMIAYARKKGCPVRLITK